MGKTFVITGTSRGIGLELAKQLLREGHAVVAAARNPEASSELQELGTRHPGSCTIEQLDVTSADSVGDFASRLAGHAVDVLVNNAAVLHEFDERLASASIDAIRDMLEVNAIGSYRVVDALLPHLQQSGQAVVVNITSQVGSIGNNTSGQAYGYRMSKAALNMFTKTMSIEFPDMVCVAIHPGWVRTDMGGPEAPLSTSEAVEGLVDVMQGLSLEDTGKFYDYKGESLPW